MQGFYKNEERFLWLGFAITPLKASGSLPGHPSALAGYIQVLPHLNPASSQHDTPQGDLIKSIELYKAAAYGIGPAATALDACQGEGALRNGP